MNIQETILGLESRLFSLHPQAKSLYEAIDALKNVPDVLIENDASIVQFAVKSPGSPNGWSKPYDTKLSMRSKALFAIKELNRFVKTKEIAEFLHKHEQNTSVKDLIVALSNPLYFLKNEQRIQKINVGTGNSGVYWGSSKWLNDDRSVKPEFMYIEEAKPEEIEL